METMQKTEFSKLSAAALAVLRETIEIRANETLIGYFVPANVWDQKRVAQHPHGGPRNE